MICAKDKRWINRILGLTCILMIIFVLRVLKIDSNITGILIVSISSYFIISKMYLFLNTIAEKILFTLGYLLRLLFLFLDIYIPSIISFLHSREDADGFFYTAKALLLHKSYIFYTYYPILLSKLFIITGCNRILAQYVNILFSILTIIVFIKLCRLKNIRYKYCLLGEIILLFQPNYLTITAFLMRESIITFFTLLFFYYLILYHDRKQYKYIFLSAAAGMVSTILHTGMIVLIAVLCLDLIFYDNKQTKIRISKKSIILIITCIMSGIAVFLSPLGNMMLSYIPKGVGLFEIIQYTVHISNGGSDYLSNMIATNYPELILYTFIRMFYFIASPLPMNFRGIMDVIAFMMSSLLYLLLISVISYSAIKMRKSKVGFILLICLCIVILFIGIHAWGVTNAGTAIRHRSKIIGVVTFSFTYALQNIKEKWEK